MKTMTKKRLMLAALALVALAGLSCSNELTDNTAPVELVLSVDQDLNRIDFRSGAAGCDVAVGTVTVRSFVKNTQAPTGDLNRVRITRYRVSYRRVDGGTQVPRSYVRPMDALIDAGGEQDLSDFVIFETDALTQAPFAALLPSNGGRDPETGRPLVKLEVILELFGETLGGSNVSDSTSFQLDFCYDCGGCA